MHLEFWNQHSPSLIFQCWEAIIFLKEIQCDIMIFELNNVTAQNNF